MSGEENPGKDLPIKDTADAIKVRSQEVPVYRDAIQPAAKKLGIELKPAGTNLGVAVTTVTQGINLALAPLRGLIWGYEQVQEIIFPKIAEKFQDKLHRLVAPPLNVAGPAIEALKYTGSEADLREMYINLLSTSMDSETTKNAHPSFVEIIRQLTPDEARLLSHVSSSATRRLYTMTLRTRVPDDLSRWRTHLYRFSEYEFVDEAINVDLMSEYLDNLCRLGMFSHSNEMYISQVIGEDRTIYTKLLDVPAISQMMTNAHESTEQEVFVFCEIFYMTTFGNQFARACISQPTS